jgi:hypothetical protein
MRESLGTPFLGGKEKKLYIYNIQTIQYLFIIKDTGNQWLNGCALGQQMAPHNHILHRSACQILGQHIRNAHNFLHHRIN